MNRISRNERTPIFFNSLLSRKKLTMNGYKVQNTFNNYYNKNKIVIVPHREKIIIVKNLERIR